jgi:hypothetical protein
LKIGVLQNQPLTAFGKVYLDPRVGTSTFDIEHHTFTKPGMSHALT